MLLLIISILYLIDKNKMGNKTFLNSGFLYTILGIFKLSPYHMQSVSNARTLKERESNGIVII